MSEPVEYQMRMRPTWEVTSFSDWKKCSRDAFDDYTKTPKIHDWEYEVRKLYTTPPQRTWVGLTEKDLELLSAEWRIVYGAWMDDFARDIEAKLKEKNNE